MYALLTDFVNPQDLSGGTHREIAKAILFALYDRVRLYPHGYYEILLRLSDELNMGDLRKVEGLVRDQAWKKSLEIDKFDLQADGRLRVAIRKG